jgi:hypothetical protein
MRRLLFSILVPVSVGVGSAATSGAQMVPARELMDFPIATTGEAPVLASLAGTDIWNPSAILLGGGERARVTVAALDGPADQGVGLQLLGISMRLPHEVTGGLSVVNAAVRDLIRTEGDPQSIGGEIPYGTTLISLSAARRTHRWLVSGVSMRYRTGEVDGERRGALGVDGGVLAAFPYRDIRLGASSFLWRPAHARVEQTRYSVAADARLFGNDSLKQVRAGAAVTAVESSATESHLFASGRFGPVEARVGALQAQLYGNREWRGRFGVGLHYARYSVGIGRDENGAGLGPLYQLTLTSVLY